MILVIITATGPSGCAGSTGHDPHEIGRIMFIRRPYKTLDVLDGPHEFPDIAYGRHYLPERVHR